MKFRHKSDRIPGLGIFGCSGSFEKVLFILKMKFQNAFCCFQKTQKCSSPFVFEDPLFLLRMDCGPYSFFLRMEGAQKGGCIPLFFMDCVFREGFSVFQSSLTGKNGSGFGFWKTVPAVPVPVSVSGKTVPTVPVSVSGSVAEPPC